MSLCNVLRRSGFSLGRHAGRAAVRPAAVMTLRQSTVRRQFVTSPIQRSADAAEKAHPAATLTTSRYEKLSDETMDTLHDNLEAMVEEYSPEGANGWEVEYSSGVLTLSLGPHGTYVINKQPPNQQIWLSSPFSGPMRFSYTDSEGGKWYYPRDQVSIGELLDRELSSVLEAEVGKQDAQDWSGVGLP